MEATIDRRLILAIKPKWVEKILSGDKTIELRKRQPVADRLLIYSTMPKCALFAQAKIDSITTLALDDLWALTEQGKLAQVSREEFKDYYKGKEKGTAIAISDVKPFHMPISLEQLRTIWEYPWNPPQGFQYISAWKYERLMNYKQAMKEITIC